MGWVHNEALIMCHWTEWLECIVSILDENGKQLLMSSMTLRSYIC